MSVRLNEAHVAYIVSLEHAGKTSAEAVLADARRPESPIHELYDWDVAKAAHAHWLDRTRQILGLVRIIEHTETTTIRLPRYVKDPAVPTNEPGYVSLEALRIDPVLARRALIAELERVTSALRRARNLSVGLGLEGDCDELLAAVSGLRSVVAVHQQAGAAQAIERAPVA